jgi:cytochrome b involved in lipid metabolism
MEEEKKLKIFRLEEVKEHNDLNGPNKDCWVVLHDKVYDITSFLEEVNP